LTKICFKTYVFVNIKLHSVSIIDAGKSLESPVMQTLKRNKRVNKSIEHDFIIEEPIKIAFNHLFPGIMFQIKI